MLDKSELRLELVTLAVFRRILRDPVINALLELLAAGRDEPDKAAAALAEYVHLLIEAGGDLGAHIGRLVLADENAYLRARIKGGSVPAELEQLAHRELLALEEVAAARLDELAAALGVNISFPALPSSHEGLARRYFEAMDALHTRGYGMFAEHAMFTLTGMGCGRSACPTLCGFRNFSATIASAARCSRISLRSLKASRLRTCCFTATRVPASRRPSKRLSTSMRRTGYGSSSCGKTRSAILTIWLRPSPKTR